LAVEKKSGVFYLILCLWLIDAPAPPDSLALVSHCAVAIRVSMTRTTSDQY
jgi:hypothetical protein